MTNTPKKYDVKRIFASAYAEKNKANIEDITIRVRESKGIKKVMVEIGFGDETGWQLVQRYWATNLPLESDLYDLKKRKVIDVLLQTGWNEDKQKWGTIKVVKFVLECGEEVTLQGPRDEPGLGEDSDDE